MTSNKICDTFHGPQHQKELKAGMFSFLSFSHLVNDCTVRYVWDKYVRASTEGPNKIRTYSICYPICIILHHLLSNLHHFYNICDPICIILHHLLANLHHFTSFAIQSASFYTICHRIYIILTHHCIVKSNCSI